MIRKTIFLVMCIVLLTGILFIVGVKKSKNNKIPTVISQSERSLPQATWGKTITTFQQTPLGKASGTQVTGTLTSDKAMINHFEDNKALEVMGYKPNMNVSADGPGSSMWGYTKGNSIILYSYKTTPTNTSPNEPLSFDCPCKITVSIFEGTLDSTEHNESSGHTLANPASTNCGKVGGTTVIKDGPNGQYGLCQFEDNMACEEWALYKGDCPVGGVKTTGYDNIQQMYCAWVGGETLAVANPNCKLPNGTICTDEAVYNGTCQTSE